MKLVLISDTHGKQKQIEVPQGDILIHAGDFSMRGFPKEVEAFMQWFSAQPHPNKILIAGNHDFMAEKDPIGFKNLVPENVTYLNDSGCEIEGIKIWGSPIQPWFHDWAFNRLRGDQIQKHWDLIPIDTDILITHGPPFGSLDSLLDGNRVGCENLAEKVEEIAPKLHVFGHIHESYGMKWSGKTTFVNASMLNFSYQAVNPPIELEWKSLFE